METISMPRDGNCLFHAIADQINHLYQLTFNHTHIRKDLAKYVEENRDQLNIKLAIGEPNAEATNNYIKNLHKYGTWGGEEIIIAAAEHYLLNVTIHQNNSTPLTYRPKILADAAGTINLIFTGNHYDSAYLLESQNIPTNQSIDIQTESISPSPTTIKITPMTSSGSTTTSIETIPDNTGYTMLRNNPSYKPKVTCERMRISTWNVRGCAKLLKRHKIDAEFNNRKIHIACIQETNMTTGTYGSKHYFWYLSGTTSKAQSGLAILIRKDLNLTVQNINSDAEAMAATIKAGDKTLYVINTHIPSSTTRAPTALTKLLKLIKKKPIKAELLMLGDFNAHIGLEDTMDFRKKGIAGTNLFHKTSNIIGEMLTDICSREYLRIETTRARRSCRVTWANGKTKSQLDHIIISQKTSFAFNFIKGEWSDPGNSDHKIIWGEIDPINLPRINDTKRKTTKEISQTDKRVITAVNFNYKQCLYTPLTRDEMNNTKTKYQNGIIETLMENNYSFHDDNDELTPNIPWESITGVMKMVAQNTLSSKPVRSREHRIALANLQKTKFIKLRRPTDPQINKQLKESRRRLEEIKYSEEKRECRAFFEGLGKKHPSKRMQIVYHYYRRHQLQLRRQKKQYYIPMSRWEQELRKTEGPKIDTVPNEPLNPDYLDNGPTIANIKSIISQMRNGTAPGTDQVVPELYKGIPEQLVKVIAKTMNTAWRENTIPESWNETIQVPIPKTRNPKDINDYRRITICNTGYRIYATYLLNKLDETIKELGDYQAAFLQNRSTDDHIFTLRRVLDEEWRAGNRTYVLALDIEKAFDTINLNILRDILLSRTNKILTNRIIKACMNERTCIKWFGQQSNWINKGKGVKQGCPLSPRLFTILMDDVLRTLEEEIPNIKLDQEGEIDLPLILSFADDLIIICQDLQHLDQIVTHLKTLLKTVGLDTNETKTKILIRDPINTQRPQFIVLDKVPIRPVNELKYLGTYITAGHSRKDTIKKRCQQAICNSKALIHFIKKTNMDWKLARLIYKMVISPCITYGLKATALTKANRSRLRKYERLILRDMLENARSYPRQRKVHDLLYGKTITKRIKNHRICFYAHILRRPQQHLLHAAFKYEARRKKVGRPIYTWKDSLKHDLEYYGKEPSFWIESAQNREEIMKAARHIYRIPETDSETESSQDNPTEQDSANVTNET